MANGGYKIRDQHAIHFLTFAVVQWVDVFTRSAYADIVVESLRFCQQKKGLRIHAWCLMPNHLHLIVSASGATTLSDIIRDFKKFSSRQVIKAILENPAESRRDWMRWIFESAGQSNTRNDQFQFWQQDNHPVECSTREILESRLIYLHENPVRAGLVWEEAGYRYSSGIDYYGNGKGLIAIDFLH